MTTDKGWLERCAPPEINQARALIALAQELIAKAKWLSENADCHAEDVGIYLTSADDVLRSAMGIEAEHCREQGI